MKLNVAHETTIITDTEADMPEQPVIIEDTPGSEGLSLTGWDGDSVFVPYRLVKEVCKQMIAYATEKKKK